MGESELEQELHNSFVGSGGINVEELKDHVAQCNQLGFAFDQLPGMEKGIHWVRLRHSGEVVRVLVVHEKKLVDSDIASDPTAFNTYFVVGQSATHQISHTKGFVADGKVGGEGSTNWSASGEGTFVVKGQPGGKGYKAQNNTQSIFTDPDTISRFQSELIAEHMAARVQKTGNAVEGAYRKGSK